MTAHAKLGASSMYRWSECPAAINFCSKLPPQPSSKYADEGTQAHDIAARLLNGEVVEDENLPSDMMEAVQLYVDTVRSDAQDLPIHVEQKLDLSEIDEDCFGTSDAWVYDPISKLLRAYDYKHGAGIEVEVEKNKQLMYYGLGVLLTTKVPCLDVELIVVQPRCDHPDGPVRRWRFGSLDLVDFATDLKESANKTKDPKAKFKSGDHCRFCPGRGVCPELSRTALQTAQSIFKPVSGEIEVRAYNPQELADTLAKLPSIEEFAKGVREFAYNEAVAGRCPPGYKLVAKRGTRKWNKSEDETSSDLRSLGLKTFQITESSLRSPAQIEKLLPKDKKKLLNSLCTTVSSGEVLVPSNDERPEVKRDAVSVFVEHEAQSLLS